MLLFFVWLQAADRFTHNVSELVVYVVSRCCLSQQRTALSLDAEGDTVKMSEHAGVPREVSPESVNASYVRVGGQLKDEFRVPTLQSDTM